MLQLRCQGDWLRELVMRYCCPPLAQLQPVSVAKASFKLSIYVAACPNFSSHAVGFAHCSFRDLPRLLLCWAASNISNAGGTEPRTTAGHEPVGIWEK